MVIPRNLFSALTRHAVDLKRFENGMVKRIIQLLLDSEKDILAKMIRIDPTQVSVDRYRYQRLEKLLKETDGILNEVMNEAEKQTAGELIDLAKVEAVVGQKKLESAIGSTDLSVIVDLNIKTVSVAQLKAMVEESAIQGATIGKWFEEIQAGTMNSIQKSLNIGMSQGETIGELTRRISGTKENNYTDGVYSGTTRRTVEAMVRTAVTHVSNRALAMTYQENEDITKEYKYMATLDGRTSLICVSLDGKVFKYDDPRAKMPPQHPRCRSVILPIIDWNGLNIKPPKEGNRASMAGAVPGDTTYMEWLKEQSNDFQDEVLGPGRAKLFRSGQIDAGDLIRTDNRIITLDELQKRNAA